MRLPSLNQEDGTSLRHLDEPTPFDEQLTELLRSLLSS